MVLSRSNVMTRISEELDESKAVVIVVAVVALVVAKPTSLLLPSILFDCESNWPDDDICCIGE